MKVLAAALTVAAVSLTGCQVIGVVGGALVGAAAGTATGNGAIAIASAVAVDTAIDHATRAMDRRFHRQEQDAIAAAAGAAGVGETRAWELQHKVTRRTSHGEVRVTRLVKTPLATCKELLFSVVHGDDGASWFTTSACQHGEKWKWAAAEPAVERWGSLQ